MKINIKATNMELTNPIRKYVETKIGHLDKFLGKSIAIKAFVEIGRESRHHQKGEEVFMAEVNIKAPGQDFYGKEYAAELYTAIDKIKEDIQREINKSKTRKQTLFIRGARKIKKRVKGMKPW